MTDLALLAPAVDLSLVWGRCVKSTTFSPSAQHTLQRWDKFNEGDWSQPDLAGFVAHLQATAKKPPISERSIGTYINQVKGAYKLLFKHRHLETMLVAQFLSIPRPEGLSARDMEQLHLRNVQLTVEGYQHKVTKIASADTRAHIWLTHAEIADIFAQIQRGRRSKASKLRDHLMIYIGVTFGLRAAEICALVYADLLAKSGDDPALLVQHGKGDKQRVIPMSNARHKELMKLAKDYCQAVGYGEGPLFFKIEKNGKRATLPTGEPYPQLTVRGFQLILDKYKVWRNGVLVGLDPHDLRRTMADHTRRGDVPMEAENLKLLLGHERIETTLGYLKPDNEGKKVR